MDPNCPNSGWDTRHYIKIYWCGGKWPPVCWFSELPLRTSEWNDLSPCSPLYFIFCCINKWGAGSLSTVCIVIHSSVWQYVCQVLMVNTKEEENKRSLIVMCSPTGELIRIKVDRSRAFPTFSACGRRWLIICWVWWSIHEKGGFMPQTLWETLIMFWFVKRLLTWSCQRSRPDFFLLLPVNSFLISSLVLTAGELRHNASRSFHISQVWSWKMTSGSSFQDYKYAR